MAVGGIFGVLNTMFAAISQRIKGIGVLRTKWGNIFGTRRQTGWVVDGPQEPTTRLGMKRR